MFLFNLCVVHFSVTINDDDDDDDVKRAHTIAIPSIRLSVCHTGGSVKTG